MKFRIRFLTLENTVRVIALKSFLALESGPIYNCVDINECKSETLECPENSTCSNMVKLKKRFSLCSQGWGYRLKNFRVQCQNR